MANLSIETIQRNDPHFVRDLLASDNHVKIVAAWLREQGYQVEVQPLHIRPKMEQMWDYSDNGDIYIEANRIEVKQRKLDFTSLATFPYNTITVDVAHAFDNAKVKPYAYILTNKSTTGCLIIFGDTHTEWEKIEKYDRFKGRTRTFYDAPLELCTYYSMEKIPQKIFDF